MRRFLTDHNFNADIVRGVLRCTSDADFVSAYEMGISEAIDPDVLRTNPKADLLRGSANGASAVGAKPWTNREGTGN